LLPLICYKKQEIS